MIKIVKVILEKDKELTNNEKVWTVNIHYEQGEVRDENYNQYHSKSIFEDCTTGEIIGGADEAYWDSH